MAKETKTIQCYPDDNIINKRIKQYESFGWELIGNQRCQEYEGQTSSHDIIDGSTTITRTYSTFNKLTFTRDKSAKWYREVADLESEYLKLMNSEPTNYAVKPSSFWLFGFPGIIVGIALLAAFSVLGTVIIAIASVLIAVSAIFLIVFCVKKVHQKKETEEYQSRLSEWNRTTAKDAEKIREKAEAIVNAD